MMSESGDAVARVGPAAARAAAVNAAPEAIAASCGAMLQ
jgi:hypothetical protein